MGIGLRVVAEVGRERVRSSTRRSTYSLSDAIYDLSSERKCEIVDSEVIFGTEKFAKGERERERESNVN